MEISEKFALIRKTLRRKQAEFGGLLGVGGKQISAIEKGRVKPSPSVIELLFVKYLVNRTWWETGEGNMFVSPPGDGGDIAGQSEKDVEGKESFMGLSLEDKLAYETWKTLTPDQKLEAIQLLRKLKAKS